MIFHDRIEIISAAEYEDDYGNIEMSWDNPQVDAVVAAHVDVTDTAVIDAHNRLQTVKKLTVFCKPFDYDHARQRIRWNGRMYRPDGDDVERRIMGRSHHVEIPLIDVQG